MEKNGNILRAKILKYLPYILLLLLILIFYITNSKFLSLDNIYVLLSQGSILLLIATGSSFIIPMGSIDLSIIANVTLSGIIAALFIPFMGIYSIIPAIIIGIIIGLMNGCLFTKLKIPSFLSTLGVMSIVQGISLLITKGKPIWFTNEAFRLIAQGTFIGGRLQNITIICVFIYLISVFIYTKTKLGTYIIAIGGDEKITKMSGVNIDKYKLISFCICGFLCGLAGAINTSRIESASPTLGLNLLLEAIAAVVIGGTPVSGGLGGVQKTFIGVLVITILSNGLDVALVSSHFQMIIKGVVILLVVILTLDRSKLYIVK